MTTAHFGPRNHEPWQPVAGAYSMSNETLRWNGRTYDLANVDDLVELSAALDADDEARAVVALFNAEADAADAEADRLRAEIEGNQLKAAAFQAANDASGMTAAHERAQRWLNGDARAESIRWHRRQHGESWQAASTRQPQARTLSSLPALPVTDENRAELIREQRRRAGF